MRLRGEQVGLLYQSLWQPVVASMVAAVLLVAAMWPVVESYLLLGWLTALGIVSSLRLWLAYHFHRRPHEQQHRQRWLWRFFLGALLAGMTWGMAGVLMFTVDHHGQLAALSMVLAGITAGGITTMSSVWWVALAFVLPMQLPLLIQFLRLGTPLSMLSGIMVAIFLALVLVASWRLSRIIHDNIGLRVAMASREAQLLESENRYRSVFHHSPLGVMHFDRNGILVDCNEKFLDIIGSRRSRLIGMNMLHALADNDVKAAVRASLETGAGYYEGTYWSITAAKTTPLRAFFNGVRSMSGEIVGGVAVVEDFSERKRAEAIIHRQAFYDALTDLPNRRLLLECLADTIASCRAEGEQGALLFLDLDRFKTINDSLGHSVGDELLTQVAIRLRESLGEDDMAARLSGDEFVVMLTHLGGEPLEAEAVVESRAIRLLQILTRPYCLADRWLEVTPSIGYVVFPEAAKTPEDALKYADTAMYQAKARGRAQVCGYDPYMQAAVEARLALEQALRRALYDESLHLHYQPQVDDRGVIIGAEALLRWRHPSLGDIPPDRFIPIAEDSDLIVDLEAWVLKQVLACLTRLDAESLPCVSVNISARHFCQADFLARLRTLLEASSVDPGRLVVELTESVLIDNLIAAAERMQALKELGVGIAIDDFGTGYSSLSYLKRLPVDELKIDRSFIEDIGTDADDTGIIEAIIAVAHHLKLKVTAEGVETSAQRDFLGQHGCRHYQGFWFHRPMPYPQLCRTLEEWRLPAPAVMKGNQ